MTALTCPANDPSFNRARDALRSLAFADAQGIRDPVMIQGPIACEDLAKIFDFVVGNFTLVLFRYSADTFTIIADYQQGEDGGDCAPLDR